jgi:DNA polymerase-4
MPRKILHVDLDAFFCAVEELRDPSLKGKAFAVGGLPNERGVVSSCSYAARALGVHSAMPMSRALKLCPGLIVIHGRHADYSAASKEVMARFDDLTGLVEPLSIDEAFLDVSDLPDPPEEIAHRLQERIWNELHLPCSIGIAANKLVAKVATDVGKAAHRGGRDYPRAITVVPPGEEAAFLAPLPVQALWGIGPKTTAHLESLGIHTIGDLARLSDVELTRLFGRTGPELGCRARGEDSRPVEVVREAKSISQETTFARDVNDSDELHRTLRELSEQVGFRLRHEEVTGFTVRLKLRWEGFITITRQVRLAQPTDQDGVIYDTACKLLDSVWDGERKVRLIGVGVSGLQTVARQLSLWETPTEKEHRLLEAVDELRERYGKDVVRRGRKG